MLGLLLQMWSSDTVISLSLVSLVIEDGLRGVVYLFISAKPLHTEHGWILCIHLFAASVREELATPCLLISVGINAWPEFIPLPLKGWLQFSC